VTDAGVIALAVAPNLVSLNLDSCHVTDAGLRTLARARERARQRQS
jgi:hypothetical protein